MLSLTALAACRQGGPLRSFTVGEELAYIAFNSPDDFEQGAYQNASLLIRDGVYRIEIREGDNELWWGQWGEVYDNVVIDVDVAQLSERNENAYGVMCRVRGRVGLPVDTTGLEAPTDVFSSEQPTEEATESATAEATGAASMTEESAEEAAATVESAAVTDEPEADATDEGAAEETEEPDATVEAADATPDAEAEATDDDTEATAEATQVVTTILEPTNGDGYLFLIQGTGSYSIMRARGRDLTPLVNWTTSEHINVGPAENHLRAVCMGDYLAFYINDNFVADVTDSTYQRGQVGLAASAASRLGLLVDFDNLTISQVNAS